LQKEGDVGTVLGILQRKEGKKRKNSKKRNQEPHSAKKQSSIFSKLEATTQSHYRILGFLPMVVVIVGTIFFEQ